MQIASREESSRGGVQRSAKEVVGHVRPQKVAESTSTGLCAQISSLKARYERDAAHMRAEEIKPSGKRDGSTPVVRPQTFHKTLPSSTGGVFTAFSGSLEQKTKQSEECHWLQRLQRSVSHCNSQK